MTLCGIGMSVFTLVKDCLEIFVFLGKRGLFILRLLSFLNLNNVCLLSSELTMRFYSYHGPLFYNVYLFSVK